MKKVILLAVAAAATVTATASAMQFSSWGPAVNAESVPGHEREPEHRSAGGLPVRLAARRRSVLRVRSAGRTRRKRHLVLRPQRGRQLGAPGQLRCGQQPVQRGLPRRSPQREGLPLRQRPPRRLRRRRRLPDAAAREEGLGGARESGVHGQQRCERGEPIPARGRALFRERAGGRLFAGRGRFVSGDADIYVSALDGDSFGAPVLAAGLNTAQNEFRPNLRRDGLEIYFDSDRTGSLGLNDIWTSTRASTSDPWSTPTNLGSSVNSTANDLRPSLSWDGTTLYFGSNPRRRRGRDGPLRHHTVEDHRPVDPRREPGAAPQRKIGIR